MDTRRATILACVAVLAAGALALLPGCGRESPLQPSLDVVAKGGDRGLSADRSLAPVTDRQVGDTAPAELATVAPGGRDLTFWPYTGAAFDGSPIDPINLVLVGQADPLQIRAALLALPPGPLGAPWTDAIGGDVQTTYVEDGLGWTGSVVQLTVGEYGPVRLHLRLFRTGVPYGENGVCTLGGAHFELQVPGTATHMILSWELAEQLVLGDLIRTGLLDGDTPFLPTGPINAAPSYRDIIPDVYNGLPPDLVALIGGPPQPVSEPVPLPSDGQGTVVFLAGAAPVVPQTYAHALTLQFDRVVPKPFCMDGPYDLIMIQGPIRFEVAVTIDEEGRYQVKSDYVGDLAVTPIDVSGGTPVPSGPGFSARVQGRQDGFMSAATSRITSFDRQLLHAAEGPQMTVSRLVVPENGLKTSSTSLRCLEE